MAPTQPTNGVQKDYKAMHQNLVDQYTPQMTDEELYAMNETPYLSTEELQCTSIKNHLQRINVGSFDYELGCTPASLSVKAARIVAHAAAHSADIFARFPEARTLAGREIRDRFIHGLHHVQTGVKDTMDDIEDGVGMVPYKRWLVRNTVNLTSWMNGEPCIC